MKVLVCAWACDPYRGSEHGVGWEWTRAAATRHDVCLITDAHNRPGIQRALMQSGISSRLRTVYIRPKPWHYSDSNPVWRWLERSPARAAVHPAYVAWQRQAYKKALELLKRQQFDIVHQLTFVGFRFPGHFWRLGLPFVWGPIGGLENTPWRLLPAMGLSGSIYYAARNLANAAQRRWLVRPRIAARTAGRGLIAATSTVADELKRLYDANSTVITEVVAPLELGPAAPRARRPGEPFKVVWSGLHLPGKALNLLLQAAARIDRSVPVELHILGDGSARRRWCALAERLDVSHRCIWHGQVPRSDALRTMSEAHVLVITSLKDLTSTVLVEGLALGLPIICPDHCGFSDVVTDSCGIKIVPESIASLIRGFERAILSLERDEGKRYRLAMAALARSKEYGRDALQQKIQQVYDRVLTLA